MPGSGANRQLGLAGEERAQLHDVLREHLGGAMEVLAQRALQLRPGARRATQTEIDPAREQRGERAELLGDLERCVVGQHDSARADADGPCGIADVREDHRCRPARDALHGVMLGNPEPFAAGRFGGAGEAGGGGEGFLQRAALAHRNEVED